MLSYMRRHWPEYLIESVGTAVLVFVICFVSSEMGDPGSPVRTAIENRLTRDLIKAFLISMTLVGLVHSRWGKQSGAHFNPAVTLAFFRLGKVARADARIYVLAHFVGGGGDPSHQERA